MSSSDSFFLDPLSFLEADLDDGTRVCSPRISTLGTSSEESPGVCSEEHGLLERGGDGPKFSRFFKGDGPKGKLFHRLEEDNHWLTAH